jgi:hypothetical protein
MPISQIDGRVLPKDTRCRTDVWLIKKNFFQESMFEKSEIFWLEGYVYPSSSIFRLHNDYLRFTFIENCPALFAMSSLLLPLLEKCALLMPPAIKSHKHHSTAHMLRL